MVRTYLKHRFTRSNVPVEVADKAIDVFGGFKIFSKSKVIHAHLTFTKDGKLF